MRYKNTDALPVKEQGEEKRCGECFHFPVCKPHTEPHETFPEVGGCKCFKNAADVVEVVRCKDCAVPHNSFIGCPHLNGLVPPPDHFCARGERREK